MAKTLREVIGPEWSDEIEALQDAGSVGTASDPLTWAADSECGEASARILRLADYVCAEWPDSRAMVREAALNQVCVVCFG